ncbi:MAG: FIST N-terminal domain-containing protein [Pseudomonadota bacterium]
MNRFLHGHATHPDWRVALALAAAQIDAQRHAPGSAASPTLGWVYLTDPYAAHAGALLGELRLRWAGVEWVGATGVGIAAGGVEYFDEPALSLMLTDLAPAHFRVFSGARPLAGFDTHTANVHADPGTADLAELIHDMSARTSTGYLFGGLASGPSRAVHIAGGVLSGGLSGVAFDRSVALVSRVTQGCQPIGPQRRVTAAERNVITELDAEPALDCLLRDVGLDGVEPRAALPKLRQVLVGLTDDPKEGLIETMADEDPSTRSPFDPIARRGAMGQAFGADTRVRHLIGLDPGRRGIAIADTAEVGMQLAFCRRDVEAARRDLTRICAEVREEVEPEALPLPTAIALRNALNDALPGDAAAGAPGIAGAIYVSCSGRGGAHFGAPSAELAIVRHALGDVPLVGFFAAGEIARRHLYGYTGVLTVFRRTERSA